jgi:hypothetical protein
MSRPDSTDRGGEVVSLHVRECRWTPTGHIGLFARILLATSAPSDDDHITVARRTNSQRVCLQSHAAAAPPADAERGPSG